MLRIFRNTDKGCERSRSVKFNSPSRSKVFEGSRSVESPSGTEIFAV